MQHRAICISIIVFSFDFSSTSLKAFEGSIGEQPLQPKVEIHELYDHRLAFMFL